MSIEIEIEIINELIEEVIRLQHAVESLDELTKIQCSNGNYDYDPYMHGMANGMLLAMSLFNNCEPIYLDAPSQWGCDRTMDNLSSQSDSMGESVIEP